MNSKLKNIFLNLKISGINYNPKEINLLQVIKLIITIFLSNVLFFYACEKEPKASTPLPTIVNWVEIQIPAELLTPYKSGKKVILSDTQNNIYINALLQKQDLENQLVHLLIHEKHLQQIASSQNWKVLPYSTLLHTKSKKRKYSYEIFY